MIHARAETGRNPWRVTGDFEQDDPRLLNSISAPTFCILGSRCTKQFSFPPEAFLHIVRAILTSRR